MSRGRYNRLKRENGGLIQIPNIIVSKPNPTEKDYTNGYITRYFCQKSNDNNSVIYEVNSKSFSKLSLSPIYKIVSLRWRIVGDPIDVKKSNSASIRIASQTIPKIGMYLPNLLQFYKK
jgi:hypothetical protein